MECEKNFGSMWSTEAVLSGETCKELRDGTKPGVASTDILPWTEPGDSGTNCSEVFLFLRRGGWPSVPRVSQSVSGCGMWERVKPS